MYGQRRRGCEGRKRERERELSKHYIDFGGDAVTRRPWLNMNGGCTFVLSVRVKSDLHGVGHCCVSDSPGEPENYPFLLHSATFD